MADGLVHSKENGGWYPTQSKEVKDVKVFQKMLKFREK